VVAAACSQKREMHAVRDMLEQRRNALKFACTKGLCNLEVH